MADRAEIFCGNSGNYYLLIAGGQSMLRHLVSDFDFWGPFGPFWRENGRQNPTKNLAHVVVLLGHFLSQNRVPKLSDPGLKYSTPMIPDQLI